MDRYTIYCTEEQTKKALELDAPIERGHDGSRYFNIGVPTLFDENDEICRVKNSVIFIPTAEQMCGWLIDEKKIFVKVNPYVSLTHEDEYDSLLVNLVNGHVLLVKQACNNLKEATLAAIDAALEYLSNNKLIK